jgi:putative transposase
MIAFMRPVDTLNLEKSFYGSHGMTFDLNEEGREANRKRVRRRMRLMGLEGLVPRPGTRKTAPGNKIYPSLLRGVAITEPDHDLASDITLKEALERYRKPKIFNTDEGAQFTSAAFTPDFDGRAASGRRTRLSTDAGPHHAGRRRRHSREPLRSISSSAGAAR